MNVKRLARWLKGASTAQPAAAPSVRVLMVCMGNICRSPTAEGMLKAKLRAAGLEDRVHVDSAGTHGFHASEPPDARAIRHAAQRGIDISGLRARPVCQADFSSFDWLLAMDEDNLAWLQRRVPAGASAKIGLLLAHGRRHAGELVVPDPYYGAPAGFERVLDLLDDACDGFVARLQADLDQGPAPLQP